MIPMPRLAEEPPFGWIGAVVLLPPDVKGLLQVLPHDIDLSNRLQDAARVAATLAMRLNDIEEGRAA